MSSARNQQHEVGKIAGIPIVIDANGFDAEFLSLMIIPNASDALSELKSHNQVLGFFTNKISDLMALMILLDEQLKNRIAITTKLIDVAKSFMFLTSEAKKTEARNQLIDSQNHLKKLLALEKNKVDYAGNVGDYLDRSIKSLEGVFSKQANDSPIHSLYGDDFNKIKNNFKLISELFEMKMDKKDVADKQLGELAHELFLLKADIQWMVPYLPRELIKSERWDEEFHPVALNHIEPDVMDDGTPSVSQKSTAPASRRSSQPDIGSVVTIRMSPRMPEQSRLFQPPPPKPVEQLREPLDAKPQKKRCCVIL